MSRANGVVRLILILDQNDREGKKTKTKTKQNKRHQCPRAARLCRGLLFRDISMTQERPQFFLKYIVGAGDHCCPHVDICPH